MYTNSLAVVWDDTVGYTLEATNNIKKGAVIGYYQGLVLKKDTSSASYMTAWDFVSNKEYSVEAKDLDDYCSRCHFTNGTRQRSMVFYVEHSDTPNVDYKEIPVGKNQKPQSFLYCTTKFLVIAYVANQDISKGSRITTSYGESNSALIVAESSLPPCKRNLLCTSCVTVDPTDPSAKSLLKLLVKSYESGRVGYCGWDIMTHLAVSVFDISLKDEDSMMHYLKSQRNPEWNVAIPDWVCEQDWWNYLQFVAAHGVYITIVIFQTDVKDSIVVISARRLPKERVFPRNLDYPLFFIHYVNETHYILYKPNPGCLQQIKDLLSVYIRKQEAGSDAAIALDNSSDEDDTPIELDIDSNDEEDEYDTGRVQCDENTKTILQQSSDDWAQLQVIYELEDSSQHQLPLYRNEEYLWCVDVERLECYTVRVINTSDQCLWIQLHPDCGDLEHVRVLEGGDYFDTCAIASRFDTLYVRIFETSEDSAGFYTQGECLDSIEVIVNCEE